jgi:hypothetical protein
MDHVAGAGLAAVYLVDAEAEELRIVHTGGGPGGFALPETLPLTADPPLADAVRADQPLWRDSVELPSYRESREVVPDPRTTRVALGVVPLGPLPPGTGGHAKGCFVVVNDARDGFGPERRVLLETYAEQLSSVMEIGAPWTAGFAPPGQAVPWARLGTFVLDRRSGRIDADRSLLELAGIAPETFDGCVESLVARVLLDDLPDRRQPHLAAGSAA